MMSPSRMGFIMNHFSDLIDTVVCSLFCTVSLFGATWLLLSLAGVWTPFFWAH